MKKGLFLLISSLLLIGSLHAQTAVDSVRIYYRLGYRYVEPAFRNNKVELNRFIQAVKEAEQSGKLEKIVVRSYTSPDGTNPANLRLAALRADSLESYLLQHTSLPVQYVEKRSDGIAWDLLRETVANSDMQYKDEILEVLDSPEWVYDANDRVIDGRKRKLMNLRGGEPYRYMYREVFPDLRGSIAMLLYVREEEPVKPALEPVAEPEPEKEPPVKEEPVQQEPPVTTPVEETVTEEKSDDDFRPLIAIKTNLLYWATVMPDFKSYTFVPNLELEWFINNRWSLAGEGSFANWRYRDNRWFGISSWSVEPRWWLNGDGRFRWLYIGAYGQVGDYDVQDNETDWNGNTGKLWGLGLSAGVAIPFSKHFGLEVGIRAGYRHSKVKSYTYEEPDYFLDMKGTDNHWGVTGIKASIYYRFGKSAK